METQGDPSFLFHVAMARLWGLVALRISEADVLPFCHEEQAAALGKQVKQLRYIYVCIHIYIYFYLYLSIDLSIYIYLSIYLCIYLSISIYLSIYIYLSICLSIYPFIYISISISISINIYFIPRGRGEAMGSGGAAYRRRGDFAFCHAEQAAALGEQIAYIF